MSAPQIKHCPLETDLSPEDLLQTISNEISLISQNINGDSENAINAISILSTKITQPHNESINDLTRIGINLFKENKKVLNFNALNEWYFLLETEVYESIKKTELEKIGFTDKSTFYIDTKDDKLLIQEFFNESQDLLSQIEQSVLVLEENPTDKETLNQIFRVFHTLKGGAGFLGLEPIKNLAHEFESLLEAIRRGNIEASQSAISLILNGRDALQQFIDQIGEILISPKSDGYISASSEELITRTRNFISGYVQEPPALLRDENLSPPQIQKKPKVELTTKKPSSIVKLDTKKLDALVELVGELIIAQSMVTQNKQIQDLTVFDLGLANHFQQLSRVTTELQRNALSMRMVPIRTVFEKISRLVRDLSIEQEKNINLHLAGEETELDRNIVEELFDPLVHMIRNSIDHGIEMPKERLEKGKDKEGNIYLSASYQGHGISIQLRDDGRGLDKQRIFEKAKKQDLITSSFVASDQNIFELIFTPGLSTAETITDVSGRGVGMDIVKQRINALRGRIEVTSTPGNSTQFLIQLPLTLAIINGIQIVVSNKKFILPLMSVRESLQPQIGMVFPVQTYGEVIRVRDELIPLIRLGKQLGLKGAIENPCDAIVVIVQLGTQLRAVMVDSLIDKKEVVIKSLGDTFKQQKHISGAAILGDGDVVLILDPNALINSNASHTYVNTGEAYDRSFA
jgi:two-component system, chemotaxis family, sensor kinase CheA